MPNEQFKNVKDGLKRKIEDLIFETTRVYENLVRPNWDADTRRYYLSLYGYIMYAFSVIDLLSSYWRGTINTRGQTDRMRDFMVQFMRYGAVESKVAVVMWRHKLMHTSEPRSFVGKSSGKRYTWLLHWHTELRTELHMRFQESVDARILMMSLVSLARDLKMGLEQYLCVADEAKFMHAHAELNSAEFDES